jgi:hypothetical protein
MLLLIFLIILLFFYLKYLENFETLQENSELSIYKNKIVLSSSYGWTDVINFLPLLSYYAKDQNLLVYYIISINFKNVVEYYTRTSKNIRLIIWDPSDSKFSNIVHDNKLMINILKVLNLDFDPSEIKFTSWYDEERYDNYKNAFTKNMAIKNLYHDFVELSYTSYDIDPIERVNSFNLDRDLDLENIKYEEFIKEFGDRYILHHEISECIVDSDIKYINLNGRTLTFFDYVKILENAIEIHLLDSVWGAVCYLLDAKYKIFKNKKIFLYAKRGYYKMFVNPLELDNWTIIK